MTHGSWVNWAPYAEFGIPDRADDHPDAPAGPVIIRSVGYFSDGGITVYYEREPAPDFTQLIRHTPGNITGLANGEVFVFGSNLAGRHGAGAAKLAHDKFGAVYGVGEGLRGRSYAFPTLDENLRKLSRSSLALSRDLFFDTATHEPHLTFLLTKVGCGLAGYPEQDMAALFADAPANVIKPEGW